MVLIPKVSFGQPPLPNHTITLRATQPLKFGAFCVTGSGGTVSESWQGTRSSTGGIVVLNSSSAQPAIFEITLCQGRNIRLSYPPEITLNGSQGGTLRLTLSPEKGAGGLPFQVNGDCNFVTMLRVGGTLTVGNSTENPPGTYTGNFSITFNQE